MKTKSMIALLMLLSAIPVWAQTEFRPLTHDEALAAARSERKRVFIDFYTDWCGPCKRMAKDVFPQKTVGDYFNPRFVCIKLNAEKEGKEAAAKYGVKAYPTFVVLDSDGKILYNHAGGSFEGEKFVSQIEQGINPDLSPQRMKQRYDGGERTAQLVCAYAAHLMEQARESRQPDEEKRAEARKMVNDYFDRLTDAQKLSAENLFVYGMEYVGNAFDPKIKYLTAHRNEAGEQREAVRHIIETVYENDLNGRLGGNEATSPADVKTLREEVNTLGLNEGGRNEAAFRLLEAYAAGDRNLYVEACEQHFKQLSEVQQQYVFFSYDELLQGAEPEVLKRAVRFMRNQLPGLRAETIYFGSGALIKLEKMIEE